jgi:hypothetical protein
MTQDTEVPKFMTLDVALDDVPANHSYLKVKKLEEDGKGAFEAMMSYMSSAHISRSVTMKYWNNLLVTNW